MDFFYSDDDESAGVQQGAFLLHDAAEHGDVAALKALLEKDKEAEDMDFDPLMGGMADQPDIDVDERDDDNCTALHVALLHGQLECAKALLSHGAELLECEGSKPIHIAVCRGAFPDNAQFALSAVLLLLSHGASPYDRDDGGRTALHLAACLGLTDVMALLLAEGEKAVQEARETRDRLAALHQAEGGEAEQSAPPMDEVAIPEPLAHVQDMQGQTALHFAARFGQEAAVALLLKHVKGDVTLARLRTRGGQTALHMAAHRGCVATCKALLQACPALAEERDRRGHSFRDILSSRGFLAAFEGKGTMASRAPTCIVAPPACLDHHTCPEPITRTSDEVPPENSNRLRVLVAPQWGILRASEFAQGTSWDESSGPVAVADLLRVHEWNYVRRIQQYCSQLPDNPQVLGHLDGDTAVSHRTYNASIMAAGAVTHAVDKVMSGQARNAFCAVRPPGHHAGPTGVVTSAKDPHGSHGFCLFNNVAVGAAYALHVYRHKGIKKVAILDFDVHHGNGTQACVVSVVPSQQRFHFKTPLSEGVQTFQVWRPWLDTSDADNIFFASVQGYGPKAPGVDAFVYPGSGATCDTRPTPLPETGEGATPGDEGLVEEDPNGEFVYTGGEAPGPEGPRVINVGVEKRGPDPMLWRRSWRDKILPALVNFKPDMIFLSAGFDAHKKDEINFGYLGIQEKEYEWLTDQVVQIANKFCEGRVVSVLEGGYRIQGGPVSAFARSVAAHVRALSESHTARYDPNEARFEREYERRKKAEQEAKRRALQEQRMQALMASEGVDGLAGRPVAVVWDEGHRPGSVSAKEEVDLLDLTGAGPSSAAPPAPVSAAHPVTEDGEGRESKRRRRTNVDYVALNRQLEEEEKAKTAVGGKGT